MPASATEEREAAVRAAFVEQAAWCEAMGSPFTALLCDILGDSLDRDSAIGRRLLDWPGNPSGWADGVPLRLCGALHAQVLSGASPALAACYPPNPPDDTRLRRALDAAVRDNAAAILPWLDRTPQTNEVGRGAALMAGLLVVADAYSLPIALFELGASAGLNLNLAHYAFDLGGVRAGDRSAASLLKPDWRGSPPPTANVRIATARGVDLAPVDPARDREALLAYVWADQADRLAQLKRALAIAAAHPPIVDRGDAADWIEARLDVAPPAGRVRVVMHSVVWQYFSASTKTCVAAHIAAAGARATNNTPVAWLRFEKAPGDLETSLRLQMWPGGEDRLLATCHAHGRWIRWL